MRCHVTPPSVQYHGWALQNCALLMPTREQVEHTIGVVAEAQERLRGRIHRLCAAGLPCALSQSLHGRMGATAPAGRPGGRCAAMSRRQGHSRYALRQRAQYPVARDMAIVGVVPALPRRGVDGRTVSQLRPARTRSRRLPLPGLPLDRQARGNRYPACSLSPRHALVTSRLPEPASLVQLPASLVQPDAAPGHASNHRGTTA